MTTMASDRLLGTSAPVLSPRTTPLAELLATAGAVLDGIDGIEQRAATVDALASELAMAAGLHDLAGTNPTLAASLRTIGVVAARTAGRTVPVDAEQADLVRLILAQL